MAKMPGFTAEISLYQTSTAYRKITAPTSSTNFSEIVPQLRPRCIFNCWVSGEGSFGDCWDWCGGLFG